MLEQSVILTAGISCSTIVSKPDIEKLKIYEAQVKMIIKETNHRKCYLIASPTKKKKIQKQKKL